MFRSSPAPLVVLLALMLPVLGACDNATGPATTVTPTATTTTTTTTTATASTNSALQNRLGGNAQSTADPSDLQIDPAAAISADARPLEVGAIAPDFSLPADDGNTYSLRAQKGKIVMLEFMATWCPHCQDDAPMMSQLDTAYKSRGVQVFGINATPRGHSTSDFARMSDLKWFRDSFGVTYPLLFDRELKSASDYGIQFYPEIYLIDSHGKINFLAPDNQVPTYDMLSSAIEKTLTSSAH